MRNSYRYKGRHRRPTQNRAVVAVARPAVVIAAVSAVSFGAIAPASAHTGEHTVRSGDTVGKLAAAHGTSWRTVYADNRDTIGANPHVLRVGQQLTIGGSSSTPAPGASGAYTVRAGDTLGRIAARHGTTWQELHAINRDVIGGNPNVLRVGQRLVLNGVAASAPTPNAAPAPTLSAAPERASRSGRSAPALAAAPAPAPAAVSASYGQWDPHVRPAVQEVAQRFDLSTVLTRPGHTPTQGRAADFMVYGDSAKGDAVTRYLIDNAARLRVDYVIWQQRIYIVSSGSWRTMEDRGSVTANHMDHPHVAFRPAR